MSSPKPLPVLALLLGAVAFALGCGSDEGESGGAELTAVATTTQVGDFLRQVGGDRVEVEQILDPNADPHDYEPRPSDVQALADAALVVRSGGDLDEWTDDLIESAGADAELIQALDSVRTIEGAGHDQGEEGHGDEGHGDEEHADEQHADEQHAGQAAEGDAHEVGEDDPHWWQDPRNAARAVAAIRDALIEADPGGRASYEGNAAAYTRELERLDREVARCVELIPPAQRRLVTTHDALGYYAQRYGFEVVGALIPSLSTQAQPSSRDIAELVEQIEDLGVRAIFPESSLSADLEAAVARETGADVGGALYADTLGPEGSSGATYVGSIAANTEAIVSGLTGGEESCRPQP